jgi:excinuclease ABC subunit A
MSIKNISVRGARQHNLKNINVEIPRNSFTVITGLSGSGKSSLAFDTIYAEGQRRYVESLSAYARQFLDQLEKPDVDSVEGLSPAISIEQKTVSRSPRSTVGTVTEIYDYLRLLFRPSGRRIAISAARRSRVNRRSRSFTAFCSFPKASAS